MSDRRDDRPELAALLSYVRAGDVLMVWRLDRLGRSLSHLLSVCLSVVEDLDARGIELRSLTEAIDTTAGGRLVFHVFGAVAQFEPGVSGRAFGGRGGGRSGGRAHTGAPEVAPLQSRPCASSTKQVQRERVSLAPLVFHVPACIGHWPRKVGRRFPRLFPRSWILRGHWHLSGRAGFGSAALRGRRRGHKKTRAQAGWFSQPEVTDGELVLLMAQTLDFMQVALRTNTRVRATWRTAI